MTRPLLDINEVNRDRKGRWDIYLPNFTNGNTQAWQPVCLQIDEIICNGVTSEVAWEGNIRT